MTLKTGLALLLSCVGRIVGQKEPPPRTKSYPNTREFKVSCDTVWPVAVQALTSNGWGVRASDHAGGILTLEWTRGETAGSYKKINPLVDEYAIKNRTGFWTRDYYGFAIVSAQVIAIPKGDAYSYTITVVYRGLAVRTGGVRSWETLPSNGSFEDRMLSEIEGKLSR
jgi:hypothetical protein